MRDMPGMNGFSAYDARNAPRALELVRFTDMQPQLGGRTLVKGILCQEQTSLIVGATQTGKTFLALDMGLHIAAGLAWFGRRVAEGAVVFVAAEAGRSIINRVAAWKYHHGYGEDADISFSAITSPVDLCHPDGDLDTLVAVIHGAGLDSIALIVVDTVSRALAGGDENSPGDMGAIVRSLDRLRDEFRCHVAAVHHFGKDQGRGARGHSLLTANLDTVIEVERDEITKTSTAAVTKQRDGATGAQIAFRLRPVELGRDEDLDPVTSCVVAPADPGERSAKPKEKKLPAAQGRALQMLVRAIETGGVIPPACNHIPSGERAIAESVWRDYCLKGGISDGEDSARRKAFTRAAASLIGAGVVEKWDQWVWPR